MQKIIVSTSIIITLLVLIGAVVFFRYSLDERQKPYKIASILPLTGKNGNYGMLIKNGLELAKEEINKNGGIKGRSLEIIYEDDQADPKLAVSATEKIINFDNVPIIFGPWASSSVLAMAPIAEKT